ncbi:MAG: ornithine carbamoyltransferase [Pirellulales bacterium]
MRHLLTLFDLSTAEIERIFAITEDIKSKYEQGLREAILPGRVMALLFEKPSLRTRVSFESGMAQLGGSSLFLGADVGFGKRESMADFGRVISEYVDVVVIRNHSHAQVEELAKYCGCPVINGLTEQSHPCQALADLYTMKEHFGSLDGLQLAWVGDGNNVARSLAVGCARLGLPMHVATPPGYELTPAFLERLHSEIPGAEIHCTHDPREAVRAASAVYTDVWTSMGQEDEAASRSQQFAPFQINAQLMSQAPADAIFMHCLPAHRGEEVTDEVIDSEQSVVIQQAGNRMHVQKGVLAWLLGSQV